MQDFFDYIKREESGKLDVLINNAYNCDPSSTSTDYGIHQRKPICDQEPLDRLDLSNSFHGLKAYYNFLLLGSRYLLEIT